MPIPPSSSAAGLQQSVADQRYIGGGPLPFDFASALGISPVRQYVDTGVATGVTDTDSGTTWAWATTGGINIGKFNRISYYINSWSISNPVTYLRVEVRDTNASGAVLAVGYAYVQPTFGQDTLVSVDLSATVNTLDQVFIITQANGYTGRLRLDSSAAYPTPTYTVGAFVASTTPQAVSSVAGSLTNFGSQVVMYMQFSMGPTVSAWDNGTYASSVIKFNNATISAVGGPMGIQPAFNRLEIDIEPSIVAPEPISIKCRVRSVDQNGAILGEKLLSNITYNPQQLKRIRFDFAAPISSQGNLWLEVLASGPMGIVCCPATDYPLSGGYAAALLQTTNSVDGTTWSANSFQAPPYARLSFVNPALSVTNGQSDTQMAVQKQALLANAPKSLVPSAVYAVTGYQFKLFWDNVMALPNWETTTPLPYSMFFPGITKFTQWSDRLTYTPVDGDAGTLAVTFQAWMGAQLVTAAQTVVHFAASTAAGTHKLLVIGDSTTGSNGAPWLAELKRIVGGSGDGHMTITQVGTNSGVATDGAVSSALDSTGTTQTINCEAWPGKTASFFYANASSPFVFSSAFNFATYLSTNSITMAANDIVCFDLGINDVFTATSDSACFALIQTFIQDMDLMIANIQGAVSGIRIGIMLPPQVAGQDGFAVIYGYQPVPAWRARRNRDLLIQAALAHYDTPAQLTNKIWVVSDFTVADPVSGYIMATTAQGQADTTMRTTQGQGVHLKMPAYWEKAYPVYAWLKNIG